MVQFASTDPHALEWNLAQGMIEEFLPKSFWREEIVAIQRGLPGRLEVTPEDGRRRYWFPRCRVRVRPESGEVRFRIYSFVFDWLEGRWQIVDVPSVGF